MSPAFLFFPYRPSLRWRLGAFGLVLPAAVAALSAPGGAQLVWFIVGAPIAEEVVFRLGVQASLQRACSRVAAVALSAGLFALCHGVQSGLSGNAWMPWLTFFPGVAFGALYAWRGQLHECVALHGLCNAAWQLSPVLLSPFHGSH